MKKLLLLGFCAFCLCSSCATNKNEPAASANANATAGVSANAEPQTQSESAVATSSATESKRREERTITGVLEHRENGNWIVITQPESKNRATYKIVQEAGYESVFASLTDFAKKKVRITGMEVSRTSPWNITLGITDITLVE